LAALLLSGCALLFRWVDERESRPVALAARSKDAAPPPGKNPFRAVLSHRYLLLLALFSLVFTCVNSNGEYILGKLVKAAAATAVERHEIEPEDLGAYVGTLYGEFFFYVNLIGLLLQTFAVSRLVRYFDFGPSFFVFPVIALADATATAFFPLLAVARIGKIAENATDYSLNNTLRQMLWLPTTRDMKYKAKQAVDTFFVRMGDVSAAAMIWAGTTLFLWGVREIATVNILLVLVWIGLAAAIVVESRRLSSLPAAPGGEAEHSQAA
jgi:AAA family ATP:ADP antiporter